MVPTRKRLQNRRPFSQLEELFRDFLLVTGNQEDDFDIDSDRSTEIKLSTKPEQSSSFANGKKNVQIVERNIIDRAQREMTNGGSSKTWYSSECITCYDRLVDDVRSPS